MMEFWTENQGQSHLDSRFGSLPRRNCAHTYHDRHQPTHYPLYYEEQQDQGRESNYWTIAGSRTGRALPEYTNWADPELTSSSSSHFPFILDRTIQHHQDLGEYQQQEARAREWTTSHRALRDYERGNLNEGWQRRWEPSSPIRYNREVFSKRSDTSHRELEAWAARYSHSLPRRKRIEAELRGAPHGQMESSKGLERGSRTGIDPQAAAMQHVQQNPNSRASGVWERGDRPQAPTYHPHPSQFPASDSGHMLDVKENIGMQRMYSQPPGYIAPPPYYSPHKSSPLMNQWDTNWEQSGKRHAHWSQPILRKLDDSINLQDKKKREREEFAKVDENSRTELKGLKDQRQEAGALMEAGPISAQNKSGCLLALQHPQAAQNSKIKQEPTSKVIEGRKFRLSKKSGGMTIFCLVSRIADTTETPSLPLCSSQTNIQSTEREEVSKGLEDSSKLNQMHKLSDEVDFRAPTLKEQSNSSDLKSLMKTQTETILSEGKEKFGDKYPNKGDNVSSEKPSRNSDDSISGGQVDQSAQPVPIKYPLWREPGSTSRTETESSPTCSLKENGEEEESDGVLIQHEAANISKQIENESGKLDIKESEDRKGLLVIDTTCVVVKVELIPSPKKQHVHYLGSTENTETSQFHNQTIVPPEVNSLPNQDVTTDLNSDVAPLQRNDGHEAGLDSVLLEKEEHEEKSELSLSCVMPPPLSEKETSEERARRILGIPLHDDVTEQQPKDEESILESYDEKQSEEAEFSLTQQTPEDTMDEGESLDHLQVVQAEGAVCLKDSDDIRNWLTNEDPEGLAESEHQVEHVPENNTDSQLTRDTKTTAKTETTEDPQLESTSEEYEIEQREDEIQSIYDKSSQLPDPFPSSTLLTSDLAFPLTFSESNAQESPDSELVALTVATDLSSHPDTISLQLVPSPLPSEYSSCSSPHIDNLPSPPPPIHLTDPTADSSEDKDGEDGASHLTKNKLNCESFPTDMSEEVVSQHTAECQQSASAACVTDEQHNQGLEQILGTLKDNHIDVNISAQQLENDQIEGVAYGKECNFIEEQPPEESEDLTDATGQTPKMDEENEENTCDVDTIDHSFQQLFEFVQGDNSVKERGMSEDQSPENPAELVDLWEQTPSRNRATDSQTQIETRFLTDPEARPESPNSSLPPASYSEVSLSDELSLSELPSPPQTPPQPDTEVVSPLDMDFTCSSSLNPGDAAPGTQETVPPLLQLESCEECIQLSSSSLSGSPMLFPKCLFSDLTWEV